MLISTTLSVNYEFVFLALLNHVLAAVASELHVPAQVEMSQRRAWFAPNSLVAEVCESGP